MQSHILLDTVHVPFINNDTASALISIEQIPDLLSTMRLDDLPDLLTIKELSAWARIPVNTLYEWRAKESGPLPLKMGKHLRYPKANIRIWMQGLGTSEAA